LYTEHFERLPGCQEVTARLSGPNLIDKQLAPQCCLHPRVDDWLADFALPHQNTLSLMPNGDFLVSFRQTSVIGIVDKAIGRFTWKWGPGQISHQHHPTYLPESGRILLFDNGAHRRGVNYSRVIEVDPETNAIAWEYRGAPPISFYSYNISSAERLPNGNTLICEGAPGRIFEVTPDSSHCLRVYQPLRRPQALQAGPADRKPASYRALPAEPALLNGRTPCFAPIATAQTTRPSKVVT